MTTDHYGNALSTTVDAARIAYDQGVHAFLGANFGAVAAFERAVAADRDFALGHAGLARALMMSGDMAGAKAALADAQRLVHSATEREQSHVGCLGRMLAGDAPGARAAVKAHVLDWPRDAMVAQMCTNVFGLIGFSGEVGREADLLAFTAALMPHYAGDWWMMSAHAVSLCETGQTAASLALMDRSLDLNPRNANGAHFRAHALYECGETEAGRSYLAAWLPDYDARSVIHGHLSWHAALWALQEGDWDAMWAAVDGGVAPGVGHALPINVLTDTAAILYRAELAGAEITPDRWAALSDYAAAYFPKTGQSFADMHAALAHAMAGEGERLAHIAESATGFAGDLVRPVARAWQAIARADWESALADLTPVLARSECLGGSRAQRDLLELAHVNVLLRMGRSAEAHRTLALRRPALAEPVPVVGFAAAEAA